jgi:undecaprenol kinase
MTYFDNACKDCQDEDMKSGFKKSLSHALHGLKAVWKSEKNFRTHGIIAIILLIIIAIFDISFTSSALIVIMIALVLFAEIVNTVFEKTLDIIQKEHHPAVGKIKDMMAGGVLLIAIAATLIALMILFYNLDFF